MLAARLRPVLMTAVVAVVGLIPLNGAKQGFQRSPHHWT
jgi:Cu/Ag efflux pump CusA